MVFFESGHHHNWFYQVEPMCMAILWYDLSQVIVQVRGCATFRPPNYWVLEAANEYLLQLNLSIMTIPEGGKGDLQQKVVCKYKLTWVVRPVLKTTCIDGINCWFCANDHSLEVTSFWTISHCVAGLYWKDLTAAHTFTKKLDCSESGSLNPGILFCWAIVACLMWLHWLGSVYLNVVADGNKMNRMEAQSPVQAAQTSQPTGQNVQSAAAAHQQTYINPALPPGYNYYYPGGIVPGTFSYTPTVYPVSCVVALFRPLLWKEVMNKIDVSEQQFWKIQ